MYTCELQEYTLHAHLCQLSDGGVNWYSKAEEVGWRQGINPYHTHVKILQM